MEDVSLIFNGRWWTEGGEFLKEDGVNIMKTAFELITELLQLEKEELELSKELAITDNVSTRVELEKEIDRLFAKELDIIEILKNTKVI